MAYLSAALVVGLIHIIINCEVWKEIIVQAWGYRRAAPSGLPAAVAAAPCHAIIIFILRAI